MNATTTLATPAQGVYHMRLALTVTHLLLVSLGTVNIMVILIIIMRPYMRSITNVYMIGLCFADFIYLANLTLVAATQLNDKSWAFGSLMCTLYHGTESTGSLFQCCIASHNCNTLCSSNFYDQKMTYECSEQCFPGKYASVMFVVLLASDRYCAMCRLSLCARYRNYPTALLVSAFAWCLALGAAAPLYIFAEVTVLRLRVANHYVHRLCIAKWPSSDIARWYITFSSILIYAVPLALIVFFYYHILSKLREALKGNKRLQRSASSRAPYHRVTRLVLWVVVFHVVCWSPFWLFNLLSSIFRLRIQTQFDRIIVNIIHLFPYINCALHPLLYAVQAENFRTAFRSLFLRRPSHSGVRLARGKQRTRALHGQGSCYRPSRTSVHDPLLTHQHPTQVNADRRLVCKRRTHSVLKIQNVWNGMKSDRTSASQLNVPPSEDYRERSPSDVHASAPTVGVVL
ncbi:unnamed protein product [Anisakis simplex]|uniref:G_PROTEIN_RECEP_F1_2 domain-containing protein n=1 Tax=Anisakis simplex TaxID=6269 RepID=A0A0M3K4L4_ANISI|nr:unnamed protein product [Anisakis simplex]